MFDELVSGLPDLGDLAGASFGGQLITNWEAEGIRIYSSLDIDGVSQLVNDRRRSDEGLFAFLQGIRLLAQMCPRRVNLPPIGLEYGQ